MAKKKQPKYDVTRVLMTDREGIRRALDMFEKENREIISVISANGRSFTFFTKS